MKISIIARQTALGLAMLYALAPLVHAQETSAAAETAGSIAYMSGGIGKGQQDAMHEAARNFNLRLEFSARKDNEFIVGTALSIADMQGKPVFALPQAGPIVNVKLPDGQYRVTASYQGQSEVRLVTVRDAAGQDVYFHWQGAGE